MFAVLESEVGSSSPLWAAGTPPASVDKERREAGTTRTTFMAGTGSSFDWFLPINSAEMPVMRLFCFPHAGGSPSSFSHWADTISQNIDLVAIAPPGRGSRMHEPLPDDIMVMASIIADGLQSQSDLPFAFFGHSFGSLVAYECARELQRRGQRAPLLLIASAHQAPQLSASDPSTWLHGLPDEKFIEQALACGFIPQEARENSELLAILAPVLRADLRLNETYRHEDAAHLLTCPVAALGGTTDFIKPDTLRAWQDVSASACPELELFTGGHFYLDETNAGLSAIEAKLSALTQMVPPSVLAGGLEPLHTTDPNTAKLCHELFDEQARRTPDTVAIVDVHRQLTYEQLRLESDLLARKIQQLGGGKGSIIGSYMPHQAEYIIGNLAIFKAGGAIFPLETNYPPELLAELAEMARIDIVLTTEQMRDMLPTELRSHDHSICLDGEWYATLQEAALPELQAPGVCLADPAYITMTSGSTGRPKGVVNAHVGATCNFLARFDLIPYQEAEREALNVFFVWECLRPLLKGATAYIIPDDVIFDPKRLVNFIHEHRITRLMTTTQLLEAILEYPGLNIAAKLNSICCWYLEGEPVPARVVNKWLSELGDAQRLYNVYSTWESLDCCYALLNQEILTSKFAPVGFPIKNVNVYLMTAGDDSSKQLVPIGTPGEIYVESPGLALEYMGDPVKTAERFLTIDVVVNDETKTLRLYRTGDRGRILPTGDLECMGRMDSTVKIRGFKVSIPFVESTIKEHPRVATAAIMPQMDTSTNIAKSLAAYIVGKDGKIPETHLQELKDDLQLALPSFAIPQHWILMDKLPTKGGESRKLDRQALPPVETMAKAPTADRSASATKAASRLEEVLLECWTGVLSLDSHAISTSDNFFEVGGHSLLAAKLVGELGTKYGINASVLDIYDHPTIVTLAQHLGRDESPMKHADQEEPRRKQREKDVTSATAIIGLAGRFPGATNLEELWNNLKAGHDALRRFTKEELVSCGVPQKVYDHPDYIPAGQVCDDVDKFDSAFWGIGKLEAEIMDPQHRVFMEVAWHAMEASGYAPRTGTPTSCGVFAASGIDGYLIHHLNGGALKNALEPGELFMTEVGSEKDYIATRVSFALNLHGPAIAVNSACSSGLVAVAQAAQSIGAGACDMAIAGASSLTFPNTGYLWEENLVYSRDGHVRPFDQAAAGTVFGDSVGAVVLKVLDDAVEDGDNIIAVLSGSSVTNDGGIKAGYTAPAASGQKAAIVAAQRAAGVTARDISYVECHATATNIGDGIEIRGLTDAFASTIDKADPDSQQFCAIGSIKGNIGHANCAAGLTGLIKTVLCLQNRQLVPTAHFKKLNDKVSIRQDSPFYVNEHLVDWIPDGHRVRGPLTAGVSSFGIGGTNAHAIVREWSPEQRSSQLQRGSDGRDLHVLTASAKSPSSLMSMLNALADHVQDETTDLTDTAFTLHEGREEFAFRAAVVCDSSDRSSACNALRNHPEVKKCKANPSVVMCFPGQGSQYVDMGSGLYKTEPVYRKHFDECCELLRPVIGYDLRVKLFSDSDSEADATAEEFADAFNSDPIAVQTSIFAVEFALAKFLIESTGVKPIAMVGHSIGEYAAAAVSGLMTLADALGIVATRAKAMNESCSHGSMLSAKMPVEAARQYVADRSDVWLACENSPEHAVFSCSSESVELVAAELTERGYKAVPLKVTHGFHSPMVQPAADAVAAYAQGITLATPDIPMTSNVSGGWLSDDDLTASRWAEHVVGTVKFVENIEAVCKWKPTVFVEVGPGTSLCSLIGKCIASAEEPAVCIPTMRHPRAKTTSDQHALASMIAKFWSIGNKIDWATYHSGERALRTPVPGYRFDKTSCWKYPEKSIYVTTPTKNTKKQKKKLQRHAPNLVRHGSQLSPQTVVYCFPFAGGSSSAFADWARTCPSWIEIVAVELPGRGSVAGESLPSSHPEDVALVAELARQIREDFHASSATSTAMVGFSMGVLMAIETQQLLTDLPVTHSFFAGRAPVRGQPEVLGQTSIDHLNLAPAEVRESEAWESYFLPMLRADLASDSRAATRLSTAEKPARIRGDVDIFCGLSDPSFAPECADQWRELAAPDARFDQQFFLGGHEFLKTCAAQIFGRIEASLSVKIADSARSYGGTVLPTLSGKEPPAHSDMLSSVAWERPPVATPAGPPASSDFCVLVLDTRTPAVQITDEHISAFTGDYGLVITLASATNIETGQCDSKESSWILEEENQCWRLLQIVNQLAERNVPGRLTLVCDVSVNGAMAVGASKSIPLEMPEIFCQRVFVKNTAYQNSSPNTSIAGVMTQALVAAQPYRKETDLLVEFGRQQRRRMTAPTVFVSRLQPFPLALAKPSVGPADGIFVPQANYIITGGLGGVGLALVDWLIDANQIEPSKIVILSRRTYDEATGPRGSRVIQADVSDSTSLLTNDALAQLGDVAGVFHLAGVLDDGLIGSMTPERIAKVAKPKVSGVVNLLNLSKQTGWDLEFLLCASSTSSLAGYAGQANYCAANQVLDHFGQGWGLADSSPSGSPATTMKFVSMNFGPWGEAGMAAKGTRAYQLSVESGQTPMSNASGMQCIGWALLHALSQPTSTFQFAVCKCDWPRTPWAGLPLISHLDEGPRGDDDNESDEDEDTNPAPDEDTGEAASNGSAVVAFLRDRVPGRWDLGETLSELGMDSLDTVQLRNNFNKNFSPATPTKMSLFTDPSVKLSKLITELENAVAA